MKIECKEELSSLRPADLLNIIARADEAGCKTFDVPNALDAIDIHQYLFKYVPPKPPQDSQS